MSGRVLHVEGYEGKVVAIDLVTDDVVASADTPEELLAVLHERNLNHAAIVKVPRTDEPLRSALAEVPPERWDFEYRQLEPEGRGHPIFRPVVPVRLASSQLRTPDERVKAFDERVVTDINELPAELRARRANGAQARRGSSLYTC